MKFRIFALVAVLAAAIGAVDISAKTAKKNTGLRLMSFNILRGDLNGPEHLWESRKDACLAMLEADKPDIFGLVECNSIQRNDILERFPQYAAVGVAVNGQVDSFPNTSSNSIFYLKEKLEMEDWGTYWLSDTPEEPGSHTWYYKKPRTLTWARMKCADGKRFVYVCVHLQDNSSSIKKEYKEQKQNYGMMNRTRAVALIKELLATRINPGGLPMLLSGDLNAKYDSFELKGFYDILSMAADIAKLSDKGGTFNGFKKEQHRIDHIFCTGCKVRDFVVDRNPYDGVEFISDHWPVYIDFTFIE